MSDRGRPVAMLVPLPVEPWDAMIESGRIAAPEEDVDVLAEAPVDYGIDASAELSALRRDER